MHTPNLVIKGQTHGEGGGVPEVPTTTWNFSHKLSTDVQQRRIIWH